MRARRGTRPSRSATPSGSRPSEQASLAAQAIAYDIADGTALDGRRRRLRAARTPPSPATWPCGARRQGVGAAGHLRGAHRSGEEPCQVAPGYGAPVVSGRLVVWAQSWTGSLRREGARRADASWPVVGRPLRRRADGLALAGRTLVWGQVDPASGSRRRGRRDRVDGGGHDDARRRADRASPAPPTTAGTVVWGESRPRPASRVMGRRLGGGPAFVVADVDGAVGRSRRQRRHRRLDRSPRRRLLHRAVRRGCRDEPGYCASAGTAAGRPERVTRSSAPAPPRRALGRSTSPTWPSRATRCGSASRPSPTASWTTSCAPGRCRRWPSRSASSPSARSCSGACASTASPPSAAVLLTGVLAAVVAYQVFWVLSLR